MWDALSVPIHRYPVPAYYYVSLYFTFSIAVSLFAVTNVIINPEFYGLRFANYEIKG